MTNKLFRNQFVIQVPKCKYSDEEYIEKKNEEDRRKKMAIQNLIKLKKIKLENPYLETIIEQDTQDIEESIYEDEKCKTELHSLKKYIEHMKQTKKCSQSVMNDINVSIEDIKKELSDIEKKLQLYIIN